MLIGKSMEHIPSMTASENMANRLADRIRNIWLEKQAAGQKRWEENFYEDPDGVAFLRSESYPDLVGIDYIFKWWGAEDIEELAGTLEVLWKVNEGEGVSLYKTWIKFADRDFIMGNIREESDKREANRKEFREAFAQWQQCYLARGKA